MKLRFIDLCKKFVILTWYQFWNGLDGWVLLSVLCLVGLWNVEAGEGQKMKNEVKKQLLWIIKSVLFCVLGCVL